MVHSRTTFWLVSESLLWLVFGKLLCYMILKERENLERPVLFKVYIFGTLFWDVHQNHFFTLFGAWIQSPVVSQNPYIWVSAVLSSGGSASYPAPCWCTRDSSYIWPKLSGYLPFMWEAWVEFQFPVLDLDQPWLCWPFGEYLSKWSLLTISLYLCLGYSVFQDRCTNRKNK